MKDHQPQHLYVCMIDCEDAQVLFILGSAHNIKLNASIGQDLTSMAPELGIRPSWSRNGGARGLLEVQVHDMMVWSQLVTLKGTMRFCFFFILSEIICNCSRSLYCGTRLNIADYYRSLQCLGSVIYVRSYCVDKRVVESAGQPTRIALVLSQGFCQQNTSWKFFKI